MVTSEEEREGEHGVGESEVQITRCKINCKDVCIAQGVWPVFCSNCRWSLTFKNCVFKKVWSGPVLSFGPQFCDNFPYSNFPGELLDCGWGSLGPFQLHTAPRYPGKLGTVKAGNKSKYTGRYAACIADFTAFPVLKRWRLTTNFFFLRPLCSLYSCECLWATFVEHLFRTRYFLKSFLLRASVQGHFSAHIVLSLSATFVTLIASRSSLFLWLKDITLLWFSFSIFA